jgi:hypothetical protein
MTASPELYSEPRFDNYYDLPKDIGTVSADELLEIAKRNHKQADAIFNHGSIYFQKIAASSYIEAMLVTNDPTHENLKENLKYLDEAKQLLLRAAKGEYELIEKGFYKPHEQTTWLRTALQADFMGVYRDILRGSVTKRTSQEINQKLDQRLTYAKGLSSHDAGGYTAELNGLKNVWKRRHEEEDPIAIPATFRGGDGHSFRKDTHDIVVGSKRGSEWDFSGREIKRGNGLKPSDLVRYSHAIMHFKDDGSVAFFESTKTPAE